MRLCLLSCQTAFDILLEKSLDEVDEKARGLLPHESHLGHALPPTLERDAGEHSLVGGGLVDLVDADNLVWDRVSELHLLAGFWRHFIFGVHALNDLFGGAPLVRVRGGPGRSPSFVLSLVVLVHTSVGVEGSVALYACVDFRFTCSRGFWTRCFLGGH